MDPSSGTPGRPQGTAMTPAVTVPGQPQPPPTRYYVVITRPQAPIQGFQSPIGTSALSVNPQATPSSQGQAEASPTTTTAAAPTIPNQVLVRGLPPTQPEQPEQGQGPLQLQQQQGQFLKQNQGQQNPGPVIMIPLRRPRQQMSIGIPRARFQSQQFDIIKRLPLQMSNQTVGPSTSMELQKNASNPTGHNQFPNVQLSQDQDLKQAPTSTNSGEAGLSNPNLSTKRDQDETVQLAQDPKPMEPPTTSIPRKSKKSKKKKNACHPGNLPNQASGSSQPLTAINALEEHVVQQQTSAPDSSADMFSRASKVSKTKCGSSESKEKNAFTIDIGEVMGMAGITLEDCDYDPSVNYPYMQAPDGSITQSAPTDVELFARDWDYMFEGQVSVTGEQPPLQSPTQQSHQGPNQMLQLQEPSQEETAIGSLPTMQMKLSGLSLFPSPMEPPSSEQEEVIDDIKGTSATASQKGLAESKQGVRGRRSRKSPVKPCALSQEMEYTISEGPPSPPQIPSTKAAKKRAARKKKQGTLPKPTQSNGSSSKERGTPEKISSDGLVVEVSEAPQTQTQKVKMRTSSSARNRSKTAAPALSADFATPIAPRTKSSSEQDDVVTVPSNPASQRPTTSKSALEPISSPSPTRRITRALARKMNPNASPSATDASDDGGVTQELKVSKQPLGNPQQPLGEQITIKSSAQSTGNAAEGAVLQVAQGQQTEVSGTPNPSLSDQVTPYWKIVPLTGNVTETPRFAFMPTEGPGGEGYAKLVVQVQAPAGSAVDVPVGPDSSTADMEMEKK